MKSATVLELRSRAVIRVRAISNCSRKSEGISGKVQSEMETVKSALSKKLIVDALQCGTPKDKAVDATRHFGEEPGFGK